MNEGIDQETLEEMKKQKAELDQFTDDTVLNASMEMQDNWAVVKNSHDFPDLIREAYRVLIDNNHMPDYSYISDEIEKLIQDYLEHEYAHHVPALGKDNLSVVYGVEFLEDIQKKRVVFRPFIQYLGELKYGLYKDMTTAPDSLSAGDALYKDSSADSQE